MTVPPELVTPLPCRGEVIRQNGHQNECTLNRPFPVGRHGAETQKDEDRSNASEQEAPPAQFP
jgi:hypothetical protein